MSATLYRLYCLVVSGGAEDYGHMPARPGGVMTPGGRAMAGGYAPQGMIGPAGMMAPAGMAMMPGTAQCRGDGLATAEQQQRQHALEIGAISTGVQWCNTLQCA